MFVGSHEMRISDRVNGSTFPCLVLYPTNTPSAPTRFGPYSIETSPNAPIAEGRFPLVVISHGTGSSHLLFRSISTHLVKHGYIVAMPEHPGNNRNNNELEGTDQNLINRPRHIQLTIDSVCSDNRFSSHIQSENIAIIGHSLGGYTALAMAGGTPWSETRQPLNVIHDSRVRAVILLAPATGWYIPADALRHVQVPILMLIAEHDPYTPNWNADVVLNGVPDRSQVTFRVVENAGHFSFLSPFPAHMSNPGFLPSTDPEGFDRAKFQEELAEEVLQYLDKVLKASTTDG